MRALLLSFVIVAAGCTATWTLRPGTEELIQRTRDFNQAFSLRDAAALQPLMAPGYTFHYIDRSGVGTMGPIPNAPRGNWPAEMFAKLSNGPLEWALVDSRITGNVGIVVSHYRWQGTFGGSSFRFEGFMTDVWVRKSGQWRIVLSTADLLPQQN